MLRVHIIIQSCKTRLGIAVSCHVPLSVMCRITHKIATSQRFLFKHSYYGSNDRILAALLPVIFPFSGWKWRVMSKVNVHIRYWLCGWKKWLHFRHRRWYIRCKNVRSCSGQALEIHSSPFRATPGPRSCLRRGVCRGSRVCRGNRGCSNENIYRYGGILTV